MAKNEVTIRVIGATAEQVRESAPQPTNTKTLWVSAASFAEHMAVSVGTVRKWVKLGLPGMIVGGRIRVQLREAEAWLMRGGANR